MPLMMSQDAEDWDMSYNSWSDELAHGLTIPQLLDGAPVMLTTSLYGNGYVFKWRGLEIPRLTADSLYEAAKIFEGRFTEEDRATRRMLDLPAPKLTGADYLRIHHDIARRKLMRR